MRAVWGSMLIGGGHYEIEFAVCTFVRRSCLRRPCRNAFMLFLQLSATRFKGLGYGSHLGKGSFFWVDMAVSGNKPNI